FAAPAALRPGGRLSGTTGNVLDPAFCLARTLELAPRSETTFVFVLAAGKSRAELIATLASVRDDASVADTFASAASADHEQIAGAGLDGAHARAFHALAAAMLHGATSLRAAPEVLARARGAMTPPAELDASDAPWILLDATAPRAAASLPVLLAARAYGLALG